MDRLFPSIRNEPQSQPPAAELVPYKPVIKVVGLGGGGGNAISRMMEFGVHGVEFIAANTDFQALKNNPAPIKIQLGPTVTRGLGAGGDPTVGREAAKESTHAIAKALNGADMVFLTAGMGGGTGSGAIPVVAEIAKGLGIVTIAVVTMPFSFEMGRRQMNATTALADLRQNTHTLITIPNDRLLYIVPKGQSLMVAFHMADDVLRQAIQGITELVTETGLINVDFAHIRRMMLMGGGAFMSIGQGNGSNKALEAIEQALHHPLLESVSLEHATGMIVNFTGGKDLTLFEVDQAIKYLQEQANPDTEIVLGVIEDERMNNRVQAILVITGIGAPTLEEAFAMPSQPVRKPEPIAQSTETFNKPTTPTNRSRFISEVEIATADMSNLDVPAFLRRRQQQTR